MAGDESWVDSMEWRDRAGWRTSVARFISQFVSVSQMLDSQREGHPAGGHGGGWMWMECGRDRREWRGDFLRCQLGDAERKGNKEGNDAESVDTRVGACKLGGHVVCR